MPALPILIEDVLQAMAAINISGAVPIIVGWLWCSETQNLL